MARKKAVKKTVKKSKPTPKKKKTKSLLERAEDTKRKLVLGKLKEIRWTPVISVHEKNIDNQHKKIIEQIKVLETQIINEEGISAIRQTIHFLDKYIKEHFTYEEAYMEKNGYPDLEKHKKLHASFIEFYENFKDEFTTNFKKTTDAKKFTLDYAKKVHKFLWNWVKAHTMNADQRYKKYIEKSGKKAKKPKSKVSEIADKVRNELLYQQRKPAEKALPKIKDKQLKKGKYVQTGVPGFDELMEKGIPQGNTLLVAGGAGSGKTIFSLQTLANKCKEGKKCLYMTLEEREDRLISHMEEFGWDPKNLIKKGKLKIIRMNPFDITRNVDAMLAKQKGELLIDVDPVIIPKGFKPDFIALDSLTAIASAFTGREENYRIYIEQLFRFFEKMKATAFLITETEQIPKIFSKTGVEEFLADGVIVMYNIQHGNVRENALEILKLRGAAHMKKIVAMQITNEGVTIYPEQEVFSEIESS